ncbi:hypothetical protein CONCODRAFT_10295 [Conidiobolus coronatus NRRL 28638]|uniref:G-protein coupled receptors family 1 profile domain-containing protein n=1 Tax=Conidiobolus coronatus (strain ATCC 28846 / CBS 209.66 / NRRL 28638) TaxID=796925 RepID=A0A137NY77_CONC2|nr:hypothetical protein CONCODRAFT_10295 [Conidiobolus coronatus NRRL 28638]|eukprot:KXN67604.1 hypothetical protein CONCODRAFT_10295 [Conidiobolus coronatus NRRL 28638]
MEENNTSLEVKSNLVEPLKFLSLIFGIIGLSLTLIILISLKNLINRTIGSHLLICLAILMIDTILCLSNIIFGLTGIINDQYIVNNRWFCDFVLLIYIGGNYISIWYVGLLSLERGLLVIHNIKLPKVFWLTIISCELLLFLIINIIAITNNKVGVATLALYCSILHNLEFGLIITYIYFSLLVISVLITIYSYIGIAITQRRRAWKDIRELNLDKDETLKSANRTITRVLALLILYLITNGCDLVNSLIEISSGIERSTTANFVAILLLNCNPIVNSIVLVQFHETVKLALVKSYPCIGKFIGKGGVINENEHQID